MITFKRGEVHEVKPDPSVGKEIQKTRPCVIVSSDVFNLHSGLAIVCPLTDGSGKDPDIIHIFAQKGTGGLKKDSIVLCDQVKAVDQARLLEKLGNLDSATMRKIDEGLKAVLGLI